MSDSIWVGISPGRLSTRLIAMRGPREVILKAHLQSTPASTQATARLLEAMALWEGWPIRAVLVAGDEQQMRAFDPSYDGFPPVDASPLYRLDWVPSVHDRRRRRDAIRGMGDFRDLEHVLQFEVAR